jgi:Spy/CpxP family protein refolding chaperone
MDRRTQVPQVTPILQQASTDAVPVGRKMIELQNQLVTGMLADKTDADLKPVLDQYTVAAASMTGIEAGTFGKIYAMLNPNQQRGDGPVEAFDLMAGWFHPPRPAGRGGGPGGRAGRFDTLIDTFRLTRDQERSTKALMDEAQKTATPVREALLKARPAIAAAVQGGKSQAEIDAAVNAYAVQSTAMAAIEMRALANFMRALTPEQRANQAGVLSTFYLVRNAFIGRNWNEVPNPDKGY